MKLRKIVSTLLCTSLIVGSVAGCSSGGEESTTTEKTTQMTTEKETEAELVQKAVNITLDENVEYQTIESFGASGAWWSQDVGGWSEVNLDGINPREEIARLLFDKETGIGLTAYRYNIGAGTQDSALQYSGITDGWRRAYSFETAPGVYDFTRDENALWFLDKAVEMGIEEIVFFCNSPLTRLTKNGNGCGQKYEDGTTSNLAPENYRAFAEYVLDVVEHFKNEGYPIKYISPVNEPQWEWISGQEGCHFEPQELVDFYNVFLDVMDERNIEDLELSAPELGEWGNTSLKYLNAIYSDERLKTRLTSLDIHSYWSDNSARDSFRKWQESNGLEDLTLKMSEWCEMVNGQNVKMDSALELAKTMHMDLTKLDVTSWQYWIAVSCYNYRDGLIYCVNSNHRIKETKRLWAMGNFSRFVRPGYVRIEAGSSDNKLLVSAYKGVDDEGKENKVMVLVNTEETEYLISKNELPSGNDIEIYVTDETRSLEKVDVSGDSIAVSPESVMTIVIK